MRIAVGDEVMKIWSAGMNRWRMRFALESVRAAWSFGSAAAEPPHSKMGWARASLQTLRDGAWHGRRALRAELWSSRGLVVGGVVGDAEEAAA